MSSGWRIDGAFDGSQGPVNYYHYLYYNVTNSPASVIPVPMVRLAQYRLEVMISSLSISEKIDHGDDTVSMGT